MDHVYVLAKIPFRKDSNGELEFGWTEVVGVFLFREDAVASIPRGYERYGRNVWRNGKYGWFTITKKKVQ